MKMINLSIIQLFINKITNGIIRFRRKIYKFFSFRMIYNCIKKKFNFSSHYFLWDKTFVDLSCPNFSLLFCCQIYGGIFRIHSLFYNTFFLKIILLVVINYILLIFIQCDYIYRKLNTTYITLCIYMNFEIM